MKRSIAYCTLALLPVFAHAQAGGSQAAAGKSVDAPVTLQAQVVQPVAFSRPARTTPAPAAAPAPAPAPHDAVGFRLESDPAETAALNTGAITARFGSSEPETTAPKLIHVVGRTLPLQRLINDENDAHVSVRAIVGDDGLPYSLSIVHSAGTELDQETLAAVRQYRFTPAIVNHVPVKSEVTVDVVLKK
jgi:TonB family protein